jgi:hypothetical protein
MKIAILTQPLKNNYGGILQAYALKEILQNLGHEVTIINRNHKGPSVIRRVASTLKSIVIGRNVNAGKQIAKYNQAFIKKYIPNLSASITNSHGMKRLKNMGFDAYIVGSDQCWRPKYSPKISNYFLDFVKDVDSIKRLSYAASFGVSEWEFNEEDTKTCAELAQKFDAISVREDSAINLVNKYFNKEAIHVLDPTMLLTKEDYIELVSKERVSKSKGTLKTYILDKNPEKIDVVRAIEKKLNLKSFEVLPKKNLAVDKMNKHNLKDFVFPSPLEWLKGYMDAEFVITDSFHGTAFAILFNIPFISIGNERRGIARFDSFLKMFGLQDRLISNINSLNIDSFLRSNIEWEEVNSILNNEREKSIEYLNRNLN